MLEPAVTLTDALLCVIALGAAGRCARRRALAWRAYTAFFLALAMSSACGAAMHGFVPEGSGALSDLLWLLVLAGMGATAAAMWWLVAALWPAPRLGRRLPMLCLIAACAYALVILLVVRDFAVAVATYLPSVFALLAAYLRAARRTGDPLLRWGVIGVALSLTAAAVQVLGIGVHPRWFDHNALYHAIQAVGLAALTVAAGHRAGESAPCHR